jgi:hypothetical protein
MGDRHRKPVPIVLAGAFLAGLTVIEEREPYHIEQRQYEEPSKLSYEIATSTATGVAYTVGTTSFSWS